MQQDNSSLPCSRSGKQLLEAAGNAWHEGGMASFHNSITEDAVTSMLICSFCDRGACEGTPICKKLSQSKSGAIPCSKPIILAVQVHVQMAIAEHAVGNTQANIVPCNKC